MRVMAISSDRRAFDFLAHFFRCARRALCQRISRLAGCFRISYRNVRDTVSSLPFVAHSVTQTSKPQKTTCRRVSLSGFPKNKKREPPPQRREDFHALQISFLNGWFGSITVSPSSSAFSATMMSIIAAAGAIIVEFSIGPYR